MKWRWTTPAKFTRALFAASVKRLRAHAADYNDPNEFLEALTQVHQWVERQLKARRDDDN